MIMPAGDWQLDVDQEPSAWEGEASAEPQIGVESTHHQTAALKKQQPSDEAPPPLPRIIEALLFVSSQPLQPDRICTIIRGLSPEFLEDTIRDLNVRYHRQARPYTIVTQKEGYRLTLRTKFRNHLEQLYGGVKEVRLSQTVVETLAVIAYRQPLNQVAIEAILGQDSASAVRQLIRRGMVQIQDKDAENQPLYATTPRFLEFFSLAKVDDLPRADDMERL